VVSSGEFDFNSIPATVSISEIASKGTALVWNNWSGEAIFAEYSSMHDLNKLVNVFCLQRFEYLLFSQLINNY
jgi:hypothetical protein